MYQDKKPGRDFVGGSVRYESCSSVSGKDAREKIKDFSLFTIFETKNFIHVPEIKKPG
jgi:hypothetical protein